MKNLIITAAAIILITSAMNGWSQLNGFLRSGERLQNAAEDAAAAAALCTDPQAFGDGMIRFDKTAAKKYVKQIFCENLQKSGEEAEWKLICSEEQSHPFVRVIVYWRGLKATAVYEYKALHNPSRTYAAEQSRQAAERKIK